MGNVLPESSICAPYAQTCSDQGGQKRKLCSLELELHYGWPPPSGYWESNPGLLQEQPVPLTPEPSVQLCFSHFEAKVSSSPGWPQTPYVTKDRLELLILLPLPTKCWLAKKIEILS